MTACHCPPEAMLFHGPLVSHPQESCRTVNKERALAPTLGLRQAAQGRPCLIVPYALHHQLKATKPQSQAYFVLMA